MLISIMAKVQRAEPGAYGETKKPKQFLITDTASAKLDQVAEELGVTRSEVLEWMLRGGGLDAAKRYKATQDSMAL